MSQSIDSGWAIKTFESIIEPIPKVRRKWGRIAAILICLGLLCSYAYFFWGGQGNYTPQFCAIHSLITRHTIDVGGYPTGADIVFYEGKLYSNKAPGNPFIALPIFLFFLKMLPLVAAQQWLVEHLTVYLTTIFTTSIFTCITAYLLYLILVRITGNVVTGLMTAAGYGLATLAFPYGTMFFSHQTVSFLCFLSFYILFIVVGKPKPHRKVGLLFIAGFLAGYAIVTEYPTFLIAALLGAYLFFAMRNKAGLIWFILGGIAAGCILLAYNKIVFGDPFFLSYKAYTIGERASFTSHKQGFLGVTYPKFDILKRITIGEQRGLFYYNPILLALFPGLVFMWHYRKFRIETLLICVMFVVFILFNSSYGDTITYWGGGASTGPRHIIPMIPFIMIPTGIFFHRLKPAFYFLFFPSFLIMLLATCVNPLPGYEYGNPLRQYFIPTFLRGELNIHMHGVFNDTFITDNSVAFNLGQIMGLEGSLSLLPLFGVMLILLFITLVLLRRIKCIRIADHYSVFSISLLILGTVALYPLAHQYYQSKFIISPNTPGLIGYYYIGDRFQGNPRMIKKDREINFPWYNTELPLPSPFCIEWKGRIMIPESGTYTFYTESDDGSWQYIDDEEIVSNPGIHAAQIKEGSVTLRPGLHTIHIKYINNWGSACMKLMWKRPNLEREIIPVKYLRPI